ncbi:hypothetical protein [Halomarina rubra]|uniref:Uncharacterized protein n=1 Tax=Halomarina rubra TaxID=2071873 RepID=A0ABD6B210_9EURY|nr:hypothetical protein [Halomarina rubra]
MRYPLPPDLQLALKIGLIAGLLLIGLAVVLFLARSEYGWSPVKLTAWGSVILLLSGAPWFAVEGDAALAIAIAFIGALGIGLVQFTRLWDQAHRPES